MEIIQSADVLWMLFRLLFHPLTYPYHENREEVQLFIHKVSNFSLCHVAERGMMLP